jgi:hypothetical protein
MARRELLDVAAAIAGSFVSRNNDVNGYWSLGLLRSYADYHNLRCLRFDILAPDAIQDSELLNLISDRYRSFLARQLTVRKIARATVSRAEVALTFDPEAPNVPADPTYGAPFSCLVRLTDHSGREFQRRLLGCCNPHNPLRELRSSRASEHQAERGPVGR